MITTSAIRLAILFGGRSSEHQVSVMSARSIAGAIDRSRYQPLFVGVDPDGGWHLCPEPVTALERGTVGSEGTPVGVAPGLPALMPLNGGPAIPVDVAFPVLHGPHGEDGTVQGLFELAKIPCVGAGVLGSAVGMDKIMMKTLFRAGGLPVSPFVGVSRTEWEGTPQPVLDRIEAAIGYPCFAKPANLGSSVGISRARDRIQLTEALHLAARYDGRLIIEQAVVGRELECSVLGNDQPLASGVGEIRPRREFYDYRAKYVDGDTELLIPAPLDPDTTDLVRELAVRAFVAISASGMARVDFFLTLGGEVIVNEINTIPGFTTISMYPKLWLATGMSYADLVDRLVALARERFDDQARNVRTCSL